MTHAVCYWRECGRYGISYEHMNWHKDDDQSNLQCNESLWLIPEGEAPIMGQRCACIYNYDTTSGWATWALPKYMWLPTALELPNESLRMFP